jgi:hypothetical protein
LNIKLQYQFDQLEKETQSLLGMIKTVSNDKLNASPSKQRWSISQISAHLITAENASLNYMKKKNLGVEKLRNSSWLESVKIVLLKFSQRLPFKYKAPKYVAENTPQLITYQEIEKAWTDVRDELRKFLESIEEKNIRKKIYKHPVAGYLDATQALIFFREHIYHHAPQVRRLLTNTQK